MGWSDRVLGPGDDRSGGPGLPRFNRLVVFSTSEHSNHGQRVPNTCPPGVTRNVLNLYYYSTHRDDEDAARAPTFHAVQDGSLADVDRARRGLPGQRGHASDPGAQ